MKTEIVKSLTDSFESYAKKTNDDIEFWLARDLQKLLGYSEWRNFNAIISKAKISCETSNVEVSDHFVDVNKMVSLGLGSRRELDDIMLTRYACYLIAQNGDPKKTEIAFAQSYFVVQTRRAEIIEQRLLEMERVVARKKLSETEKELSRVILEQTGSDKNFALIRSKGDHALFTKTTQEMKEIWHIPNSRPLADYAPTVILKAKDFASEITIFNARQHKMKDESKISNEHVSNNKAVRATLLKRGITPENLSVSEDVKKLERRLNSDKQQTIQKRTVKAIKKK